MHLNLQVVAAVGFKGKRLDIPRDLTPQVASIIEACWAKYVAMFFHSSVTWVLVCFDVYFKLLLVMLQRTMETSLLCCNHGYAETTN